MIQTISNQNLETGDFFSSEEVQSKVEQHKLYFGKDIQAGKITPYFRAETHLDAIASRWCSHARFNSLEFYDGDIFWKKSEIEEFLKSLQK